MAIIYCPIICFDNFIEYVAFMITKWLVLITSPCAPLMIDSLTVEEMYMLFIHFVIHSYINGRSLICADIIQVMLNEIYPKQRHSAIPGIYFIIKRTCKDYNEFVLSFLLIYVNHGAILPCISVTSHFPDMDTSAVIKCSWNPDLIWTSAPEMKYHGCMLSSGFIGKGSVDFPICLLNFTNLGLVSCKPLVDCCEFGFSACKHEI